MSMYAPTLETFLETEEFISAEEYLRRRKSGEINPASVRVVPADMNTGDFGGFMVKLPVPRYRVTIGTSFGDHNA